MMKSPRSLLNHKRGQVFLLLALVILLYLILLSTTVYQITQIPYIEPTPNQDQTLNYIDNTISSIYSLVDVSIAQYSQGYTNTYIENAFDQGLEYIKEYLEDHNFVAEIEYDSSTFSITNSSSDVNPVSIDFESDISLLLINPEISYEATFSLLVSYYMEISSLPGDKNYITVYKTVNGQLSLLSNCDVSISPSTNVINLTDGRYQADLQTGQTITVIIPDNIYLWMEI